jgi:hypothetical protein
VRLSSSLLASIKDLRLTNKKEQSTGVSVTDTTSEANSEVVKARPSGVKMRPSTPLKKKMGPKTTRMINVA